MYLTVEKDVLNIKIVRLNYSHPHVIPNLHDWLAHTNNNHKGVLKVQKSQTSINVSLHSKTSEPIV